MPKTAVNYSNTIIYKLCCNDVNVTEIYVGHTTNFTKRKQHHKIYCNNENDRKYNTNVYKFIRNNGDWSNWSMVEIEKYPCEDVLDAFKRERYWIETLKATLNSNLPSHNQKEWQTDNKAKIKETKKLYCEKNKEIIAEKCKVYRENNKEMIKAIGKDYRERNKEILTEKNKKYREQNKETLNDKQRQNYQDNKDEINEKRRQPYTCCCGSNIKLNEKSRHNKSIKHTKYLEEQQTM
jgi:hypothetical protein